MAIQEIREEEELDNLGSTQTAKGVQPIADNESLDGSGPSGKEQFAQSLRTFLEFGGLMFGGAVGAATGTFGAGPVGTAVGGTVGAGLGHAGGKELADFADTALGISAPGTVKEELAGTAESVGEGLTIGAGSAVGGKVAGGLVEGGRKVLQPLRAPFARNLRPEDKAARVIAEREGVQLTPFDVTRRITPGRAESTAEQGLMGSQIMRDFNNARIDAVNAMVGRVQNKIGPEQLNRRVGRYAKAITKRKLSQLATTYDKHFKAARQLAGSEPLIPSADFKKAAQSMIEEEKLVGKSAQFQKIFKLAEDILKLPDNITFAQARAWQKRIGLLSRTTSQDLPAGAIKQLYKGIGQSVDKSRTAIPAANQELDKAKKIFKERLFLEDETIIGRLIGKKNDEVVSLLFKPQKSVDVLALRAISTPEQWKVFERTAADRLLMKSGKNLSTLGNQLRTTTDETLNAWFRPESVQALKDVATVTERINFNRLSEAVKGKAGLSIFNLIQGGAAITLGAATLSGALPEGTGTTATAAVVLSPPILAKLITNPTTAKWLSVGIRAPKGSPLKTEMIAKLSAAVASKDFITNEEEMNGDTPRPNPPLAGL